MKVIAVSHGSYSKGLVDSVQMLVGEQESLVAVSYTHLTLPTTPYV